VDVRFFRRYDKLGGPRCLNLEGVQNPLQKPAGGAAKDRQANKSEINCACCKRIYQGTHPGGSGSQRVVRPESEDGGIGLAVKFLIPQRVR